MKPCCLVKKAKRHEAWIHAGKLTKKLKLWSVLSTAKLRVASLLELNGIRAFLRVLLVDVRQSVTPCLEAKSLSSK